MALDAKVLDAQFAVRFVLPNGEQMAMPCGVRQTFADVKEQIWNKKQFEQNKKQKFVFRHKGTSPPSSLLPPCAMRTTPSLPARHARAAHITSPIHSLALWCPVQTVRYSSPTAVACTTC
jgi:hypothetical protein